MQRKKSNSNNNRKKKSQLELNDYTLYIIHSWYIVYVPDPPRHTTREMFDIDIVILQQERTKLNLRQYYIFQHMVNIEYEN